MPKSTISILPAALMALLCAGANVSSQSAPSLDSAIQQLTAESANILPVKDDPKAPFVFRRPHPAVIASLIDKPGIAAAAASQLNDKFSGEFFRDAYVRWHLMAIVLQSSPADAKASVAELIKALKAIPPYDQTLPKSKQKPTWADPAAANKYYTLRAQTAVKVGYPPFQRTYYPPEAFKYYTPEQKQIAEAAIKQLETMAPLKMTGGDPDYAEWNSRRHYVGYYLWQYRFDVLYALARSGSDAAMDALTAEFVQSAKAAPSESQDVIEAMEAALRDGSLSRFKPEKLRALPPILRRAALTNKAPFFYYARYVQSLSNSVLHVANAIESGRIPAERDEPVVKPITPTAATKPTSIRSDALTIEIIDAALKRATESFLSSPIKPLAQSEMFRAYAFLGYLPSQEALMAWALLSAGVSSQSPSMQQHLNWVMGYDTDFPYDVGTRLQLFSYLPAKGWDAYIKRDIEMLGNELTMRGNFTVTRPPAKRDDWGNNADGQYGVMGIWVGNRRGFSLKPEIWQKVDEYWRKAQLPAQGNEAGWGLVAGDAIPKGVDRTQPPYGVSGPMTAAGVMSLCRTDHVLRSVQRLDVGQQLPRELQLGLNWLDHHFTFDDTRGDQDSFYYMWAIQNLGQATGYRTFNKIDWFRDASTRLINSQGANGQWTGPKGPVASTSFAILYLARAKGPLAIAKVRFDGNWNNRPADLFNFTEYLTEQFEVPTSWLVVDLAQPVYEMIESPLLYFATDKSVTLSDEQATRMKEYVAAGGMIVCVPEGKNIANAMKSYKAMAAQLFPGNELKKLDRNHPFFSLQLKVTANINLSVVENAVRPLMVVIEKDLGRDLQADDEKNRDGFRLLANIYLYATGYDAKRPRLQTNYLVSKSAASSSTAPSDGAAARLMSVARIKTAEGQYDPEPAAMPQLAAFMSSRHGIDLKVSTCAGVDLTDQKLAFLTIARTTSLAAADITAIRKWLDAGGTLWIDVARGDEAAAAQEDSVISKLGISPSSLKPISADHVILSGKGLAQGHDNRRPAMRRFKREPGGDARLLSGRVGDRQAVLVSRGDLASGLAGINHWEIAGMEPKSARQVVANLIVALLESPEILNGKSSTTAPATSATTQRAKK